MTADEANTQLAMQLTFINTNGSFEIHPELVLGMTPTNLNMHCLLFNNTISLMSINTKTGVNFILIAFNANEYILSIK